MKVVIGPSVVVLLVTLLNVEFTLAGWNKPLTPKEYQKVIGQGFSVGFFKGNFHVYDVKMIKAVYDAGFRNLRLRCPADLKHLMPFDGKGFQTFLDNIATVVDDCLYYNVTPIISYGHQTYQADTTTKDAMKNYVGWWKRVATKLMDKDYRLGFDLFTELADAGCRELLGDCSNSLKNNHDTYNKWTEAAIAKIRGTGGNNNKRTLILASPLRSGQGLHLIDDSIYKKYKNLMVEFHTYASGPNQKIYKNGSISFKYWKGDGTKEMRDNVKRHIKFGTDYTAATGILTYWGAWMPLDNKKGSLKQSEVISFAKYFVQTIGKAGIPWSLNSLFWYWDTKTHEWDTKRRDNKGTTLKMNEILDAIKGAMKPYTPYATKG